MMKYVEKTVLHAVLNSLLWGKEPCMGFYLVFLQLAEVTTTLFVWYVMYYLDVQYAAVITLQYKQQERLVPVLYPLGQWISNVQFGVFIFCVLNIFVAYNYWTLKKPYTNEAIGLVCEKVRHLGSTHGMNRTKIANTCRGVFTTLFLFPLLRVLSVFIVKYRHLVSKNNTTIARIVSLIPVVLVIPSLDYLLQRAHARINDDFKVEGDEGKGGMSVADHTDEVIEKTEQLIANLDRDLQHQALLLVVGSIDSVVQLGIQICALTHLTSAECRHSSAQQCANASDLLFKSVNLRWLLYGALLSIFIRLLSLVSKLYYVSLGLDLRASIARFSTYVVDVVGLVYTLSLVAVWYWGKEGNGAAPSTVLATSATFIVTRVIPIRMVVQFITTFTSTVLGQGEKKDVLGTISHALIVTIGSEMFRWSWLSFYTQLETVGLTTKDCQRRGPKVFTKAVDFIMGHRVVMVPNDNSNNNNNNNNNIGNWRDRYRHMLYHLSLAAETHKLEEALDLTATYLQGGGSVGTAAQHKWIDAIKTGHEYQRLRQSRLVCQKKCCDDSQQHRPRTTGCLFPPETLQLCGRSMNSSDATHNTVIRERIVKLLDLELDNHRRQQEQQCSVPSHFIPSCTTTVLGIMPLKETLDSGLRCGGHLKGCINDAFSVDIAYTLNKVDAELWSSSDTLLHGIEDTFALTLQEDTWPESLGTPLQLQNEYSSQTKAFFTTKQLPWVSTGNSTLPQGSTISSTRVATFSKWFFIANLFFGPVLPLLHWMLLVGSMFLPSAKDDHHPHAVIVSLLTVFVALQLLVGVAGLLPFAQRGMVYCALMLDAAHLPILYNAATNGGNSKKASLKPEFVDSIIRSYYVPSVASLLERCIGGPTKLLCPDVMGVVGSFLSIDDHIAGLTSSSTAQQQFV